MLPRPHDTGLVTLMSQDSSEFALHVRAFTGMPIKSITQYGPCACGYLRPRHIDKHRTLKAFTEALDAPQTQVRLFGKPDIDGRRRLGVALTSS